jgi:GNAT superfamily N-acetyltransferase
MQARPYQDGDKHEALAVLQAAFGSWPYDVALSEQPGAYFDWKHAASPWGSSSMFVVESEGRIIGFRAFMPWRFLAGKCRLTAFKGVDAAVHPAYQRRGVSRLILQAADRARREGRRRADLVFGTPNEKSAPGAAELGRAIVGPFPVVAWIRRSAALARRLRMRSDSVDVEAETPADAQQDAGAVSALIAEARSRESRLATDRDIEYLRWRYPASFGYHAVRYERADRLAGLALFRVRRTWEGYWEALVSELVVPPDDHRTARKLLRRVARAAPVDWLTCSFPSGSPAARAAMSCGFRAGSGGMKLSVLPATEGIRPDPRQAGSWALTLGDMEELV